MELAEGVQCGQHARAPLAREPQDAHLFGERSPVRQAFRLPPVYLQGKREPVTLPAGRPGLWAPSRSSWGAGKAVGTRRKGEEPGILSDARALCPSAPRTRSPSPACCSPRPRRGSLGPRRGLWAREGGQVSIAPNVATGTHSELTFHPAGMAQRLTVDL